MKKFVSLLAVIFLFGACSGSGSGKPSLSQIEKQFRERMAKVGVDKIIDIANFSKINGMQSDDRTYTVEVEYDYTLKYDIDSSLVQKIGPTITVPGMNVLTILDSGKQYGVVSMSNYKRSQLGNPKIPEKAGDKCHVTLNITLIKTDNGWIIKDSKVMKIKPH
jgi:hypothetical protein